MPMPTISMPLAANFSRTATNTGISSRQGAQQVAQKLETSTRPCNSRKLRLAPETSSNSAVSNSAAPIWLCGASAPTKAPATAAPAPIAPRIRTSRLAGAIAQERPDLGDAGTVHHPARLRGLKREALVARIEYRQLEGSALPRQRQHADRVRAVPRVAPALMRRIGNAAVHQEQLDILGAFGEQLQLDLGVAPCDALQDRAGQVRVEAFERAHRVERHATQLRDPTRLLLGLVESAVTPHLGFDLIVPWQRLRLSGAEPARCLALGESKVLDAVLGHDARRCRSDARPHSGRSSALAAHGCRSIIA